VVTFTNLSVWLGRLQAVFQRKKKKKGVETMIHHIQARDWDAAIAGATRIIDANKPKDGVDEPEREKKEKLATAYYYRGIAHCFMPGKDSKDGKHNDAVSDLSAALALIGEDEAKRKEDEAKARYYRAFAYYLDGDYERALAGCEQCGELEPVKEPEISQLCEMIYRIIGKHTDKEPEPDTVKEPEKSQLRGMIYRIIGNYTVKKPEINELRGAIYRAMGAYEKAAEAFGTALKWYYEKETNPPPPPSLLSEYIEARKKMNRA
jgi:tetratricopeptide (TPR) repeat protein